jgi:hypothetical protein
LRDALGVGGAIVVAGAAIFYLVEIFRGETRPQRVSWAVWAVIGVLGYGTASAGGAGAGAYVAGVYMVACIATFAVSLAPRYGKPGGARYDWPLGAIAIAGLVLWRSGALPDDAGAALAVGCDGIALWPTMRGALQAPRSESRGAWTADVVGNTMAVGALNSHAFASAAYPVYLLVATAVIAGILWARQTPKSRT